MIRNVTSEEMKEIFKGLKEQGWNPQWCNTPVPLFDSAEKAIKYLESGDAAPDGYAWMPEESVKGGAKSAPAGEEPTDKA